MKKYCLFLITLSLGIVCFGQNRTYLKARINPAVGWSNTDDSKVKFVNPVGLGIGFVLNDKISLETGLCINKVGYRFIRVVESIGVIDGFNTYLLKGSIPVKQKRTEKFIGIPFQMNYSFFRTSMFDISMFANGMLNLFYQDQHKDWYYYKTEKEFFTKNTFVGTIGRDKLAFSYELGAVIEKEVLPGITLVGGVSYMNLFHNHKYPFQAEKREFHNIGLILSVKYQMKRRGDEAEILE